MGLLDDRLLWLSALGTLLSGGLLLVVVGYVALVVYSGLATGTPLVGALLGMAVPVVVGVGLLFSLLVASVVGLAWALARKASLPHDGRLAGIAERVEGEYPSARALGLADLLTSPAPPPEERAENALADLKRRYVDGEISETEFERKVGRLVATEDVDEARADRERERARVVDRE